jgi:ribonuclease HI
MREDIQQSPHTSDDMRFTSSELNALINNLKSNKTPGWDQINDTIIKTIHSIDSSLLLNLYNKCLDLGYFPEIWKISIIKIFLKSSDKPKTDVKSYRPISLLSLLAKILEKLIINRINHFLLTKDLLSDKQFGFTPQKSTEDALKYVLELGQKAIKSKSFLLIIVLDIKGAFDHCFWPQILSQLKFKNIPKNLYEIIKSYLNNRFAIIKIGNTIISKKLTKGCPQGSALGPGLWNINYDELLSIRTPENCEIAGCCDDTKALIFEKSIEEIETKANQLLKNIHKWGQKAKLEFNTSKTTALLITNKRQYKSPDIFFDKTKIEIKESVKYLGVYINRKLNFNQHIEYIHNKLIQKITKLPLIAKNMWGLRYDSLKTIYKAAVEPSLLYCSSVWGQNLTKRNELKLKKIQRLFAMKTIRSYRTISFEAAVTIAGMTSIDLKIKEINKISKIKKQINSQIDGLLTDSLERKIKPNQRTHPVEEPHIVFIDSDRNPFEYDLKIFTDGSKVDSSVGSTFCVFGDDIEIQSEKYKIGPFCSVFQSELVAIKKSVEFFKRKIECNNSENSLRVLILSDSQSAISAIKQHNNSHPIVCDIKNLIRSVDKKVNLHIQWVRGHNGVEGNERADTLAKEAANLDLSEYEYDLYPLSFAKKHFKILTLKEWEKCWTETTKASQTKMFFPTISDRLSVKCFRPNHVITQYVSGHGDFNSYLKRFNRSDSELCDCGQAVGTPLHAIYDCVLFNNERHQLINSIHRSGQTSLPPKCLISDENVFKEFVNFINSINSNQ